MITDEMVEKAVQVWLENASDYTRLHVSIRAALEAVAPMIAAEAFREAYLLQAYKGKTGRDAYLARAQELDPQ